MRAKFSWLIVIGIIGTGGTTFWWQHDAQARLRDDLRKLREKNQTLAQLREENQRLAAAQPSTTELDNLRADHAAIAQLRTEIDAMQARVRSAAEKSAASLPERFTAGSTVSAGDWKNAGTATPQAALETVLWAAAGGDVDAFARCLPSTGARKQEIALLDSLPAEQRAHYGTPERLIASLAIRDVPLGAAQVLVWNEQKGRMHTALVQLQLSAPDGKSKEITLLFMNESDGWKLTVPNSAIAKYAAQLKSPP